MKTYWTGEGKYQKEYRELMDKYGVNWGYTESPIMNMLIAGNKIYYDFYNNGGMNLPWTGYIEDYGYLGELVAKIQEGCQEVQGTPSPDMYNLGGIYVEGDLEKLYHTLEKTDMENNYVNLEKVMDAIILLAEAYIKPFPIYTLYFDFDNETISRTIKLKQTITFGEKSEMEAWYDHRVNSFNYTVVNSEEEQEHKAHIVKETRLASYREVIANLGERQQTIVQKFKESGKYYTARELAQALYDEGKLITNDRNMVQPRLTELVKAKVVKVVGKKKDVLMNRMVAKYSLVDKYYEI